MHAPDPRPRVEAVPPDASYTPPSDRAPAPDATEVPSIAAVPRLTRSRARRYLRLAGLGDVFTDRALAASSLPGVPAPAPGAGA